MNHSEMLLNNLHKIFRKDTYLINLLSAAGINLDYLENKSNEIGKEFWFDTMSEIGIAILEKQMDYYSTGSTLSGKREELEGRWKIAGKCDLELLQKIADSWRNGEVAVTFKSAVIEITFISLVGIPRDIEALKKIIGEAKPAHLPIKYNFIYRNWGILLPDVWGYYKDYTWEQVLKLEGV